MTQFGKLHYTGIILKVVSTELRSPELRNSVLNSEILNCEIKMIVISTPRIERLTATWAPGFALHVLLNGEFYAAGTAEYRLLVPLPLWPDFDRVIGECGVTIFAGIVDATALHLDRNNVARSVIVLATSLRIKIDAANLGKSRNHCEPRKNDGGEGGIVLPPLPASAGQSYTSR